MRAGPESSEIEGRESWRSTGAIPLGALLSGIRATTDLPLGSMQRALFGGSTAELRLRLHRKGSNLWSREGLDSIGLIGSRWLELRLLEDAHSRFLEGFDR